jgi:uncharacterized phiE125 gp8 family phage protein
MPAILTTPPAIEPVSLADAKAHLRIAHADEDALISTLVIAARQHIEGATGLKLLTQAWSIFADRWPEGSSVKLMIAPLAAVTSVKVYGEDDVAAAIDPAHYFLDRASRPPRLALRSGRVWPLPGRIANGIEIAVSAGFGPAVTDVPAALRQACLKLVAHWYAFRGDDEGTRNLPPAITAMLSPYREARL